MNSALSTSCLVLWTGSGTRTGEGLQARGNRQTDRQSGTVSWAKLACDPLLQERDEDVLHAPREIVLADHMSESQQRSYHILHGRECLILALGGEGEREM